MKLTRRRQPQYGWAVFPSPDYEYVNRRAGITLCEDSLRKKINIPKDIKVIYAVFSKTKPNDECFTLTRPTSSWQWQVRESRVKESKIELTLGVTMYLGMKYDAGYRFVHFEC